MQELINGWNIIFRVIAFLHRLSENLLFLFLSRSLAKILKGLLCISVDNISGSILYSDTPFATTDFDARSQAKTQDILNQYSVSATKNVSSVGANYISAYYSISGQAYLDK